MMSSTVAIMCVNAIFFSLIFWGLTFMFKFYYSNKNCLYKNSFYECGFKSLTNIKVQYSVNFMLIVLFLLMYDGEFLILIPFSLNLSLIGFSAMLIIFFFISLLMFTLMFDLVYNSLEWQI